MAPEPIRVLHCPTMIGGHPPALARAERELGLASWAVAFESTPVRYPIDELLFEPPPPRPVRELRRWRLLLRALRSFDVVHFNFGSTIMPRRFPTQERDAARSFFALYAGLVELRDAGWLRRAGKAICVTYQGDDARQLDYCREHFEVTHAHVLPPDGELDGRKRDWIARLGRVADRTYALNPDLLHVLPAGAEFLPYGHVDVQAALPVQRPPSPEPLVVHAPSDRLVKGTRHVLGAVAQLEAEGVPLRFALVEDLPHEEARRLYAQADVVIDQLLVGWYGGLAVEAMALGTPVVSFVREGDLGFLSREMRSDLPVVNATPATLVDVLRDLLTTRRGELPELGRRSRAFVERHHDPLAVAARLKADYEAILAR